MFVCFACSIVEAVDKHNSIAKVIEQLTADKSTVSVNVGKL